MMPNNVRDQTRRSFLTTLGAGAASMAGATHAALSPHIFNTEADVDTALRALRAELA